MIFLASFASQPLRMPKAVALTASSIRTIKKEKMLQMLRKNNKTSNSFVAYLLSSVKNYRDHVAQLTDFLCRTTVGTRTYEVSALG